MRKTLGNITYMRTKAAHRDPEKEKSRSALVMAWRRQQMRRRAVAHVKRVSRNDGLARSVEELYDRDGRPPQNIDIEHMMVQYKRLKRQHGWLEAMVKRCRFRLRELDLVRFIHATAAIEQHMLDRQAARYEAHRAIAQKEQRGKKIPAKLAALIKVDVVREVRRHELRNTLTDTLSGQYLPLSRYIQEVMRYMHYEDIPEANRVGIDPDPEARYQFLLSAYFDMVVLVEDIESKIYDLQEYVESADLLLLRET